MRSFEIFVAAPAVSPRFDPDMDCTSSAPQRSVLVTSPLAIATFPSTAATQSHEAESLSSSPRSSASSSSLSSSAARAREALDVFVDGANVTARFANGHASSVLRDLALGLAALGKKPHGKTIVHFYEDAGELAVERSGARAWISVYRGGADPRVSVYDRPVLFADVVASAREATLAASARDPNDADLAYAADALAAIEASSGANDIDEDERELASVHLDIEDDAALSFGADFALRAGIDGDGEEVERADLHALLFRGKLRAGARGRSVSMGEAHPFLFAERLLDVAARALDEATRGAESNVRVEAGGVTFAVRLSGSGEVSLTVGDSPNIGCTFPALSVQDLVDAALSFGRGISRAILRRDRSQAGNLRFGAFRRRLRQLGETFREVRREDVKVNPRPEAYRTFAAEDRTGAREQKNVATPAMLHASAPTRLRYATRWRALVPGIDLRGTFLCGDRLIVGAAAETFCLDRGTGQVIWRVPTSRATSLLTPGGVVRLHADGNVHLHDFGDGEITMRAEVAPRIGAAPLGVVVGGAGLPRLLVVTEGERHLVALDLVHGQARWRAPWTGGSTTPSSRRSGDTPRKLTIKRAGKLLYVTSGDSALTALDALSGAVVWRMRDPLRFRGGITFGHDLLYAVAGGARGKARLHAVDPFSGQVRWSSDIVGSEGANGALASSAITVDGAPILSDGTVAVALRDRRGVSLVAFDRATGEARFRAGSSSAPLAAAGTAWVGIDDLYIGNSATGELVGVESATGVTRYRLALGRSLEEDTPRRLDPVLRSGALFVPHTDVHVFRPRDGVAVGSIAPCDAIPDLLRVDERCDVYVAEESGHLVSFAAGPRLSLVR